MRNPDVPQLQLHAFEPMSRANGPGARAVIWTQGCGLRCPGCFNPETHATAGGSSVSIDSIFDHLRQLGDTIEGVTVSGGEPLQQLPSLMPLLQRIRRETALSSIVFTGFAHDLVCGMREADPLRRCVDVLIAGPFLRSQHLGAGLRGSANKSVHFWSDRYGEQELREVPISEVIIDAEGDIVMTGIDPLICEASHGIRG